MFSRSWLVNTCVGLLVICLLSGCEKKPGGATATQVSGKDKIFSDAYPIRAVSTVGMVADVVSAVGGDKVQSSQLLRAGIDPHTYSATRDDMASIMQGDMVFYSGLLLEGQMAEALKSAGDTRPSIAVAEGIPAASRLQDSANTSHNDPHVWMDVSLWIQGAEVVAQALAKFDPVNAEDYHRRATAWKEELQGLHEYCKTCIASIPENSRVLITSHDAFQYFGRAYGIEVMGVQGISTESEAGLQDINELVDLLVERKIPAVFCESSVSQKSIDAVVAGAKSRGQEVKVLGPLFSDAMGTAGTWEGTYAGMLDHNATLITRGLGGTAPETGWKGKLAK